jgi:hypothetical protein
MRYQVFPGRTGPSQQAVNQAIEGVQEYLRNSDTGIDDESLELYGVLITQGQYQGQSWFVAGTEDNRYYFWHAGELHALDGSLPGATYSLAGKGIGVFDNGDFAALNGDTWEYPTLAQLGIEGLVGGGRQEVTQEPTPTPDFEVAAALGFEAVPSCTDESGSAVRAKFSDGFVYCLYKGGVVDWAEGSVTLEGYAYPIEVVRSGQANYIHILNTDLVRVASDEETYALLYGPLPAPTTGPCAPYLFDDFNDPFLSRLAEGNAQPVYYGIQDGEYHIVIRRAQMPFWAGMKRIPGVPADFAMVADVRWAQDDPTSAAGVLFNIAEGDPPAKSMAFRLYGDGRYGLFKEETAFGPLEIAPGFRRYPETNQLGLVRQGENVSLYLNGVQLAQFTESDWVGRPGFGLTVVGGDNVPIEIIFDNLAVYPLGCWP